MWHLASRASTLRSLLLFTLFWRHGVFSTLNRDPLRVAFSSCQLPLSPRGGAPSVGIDDGLDSKWCSSSSYSLYSMATPHPALPAVCARKSCLSIRILLFTARSSVHFPWRSSATEPASMSCTGWPAPSGGARPEAHKVPPEAARELKTGRHRRGPSCPTQCVRAHRGFTACTKRGGRGA